jgi:hypothetical protein
LQTCTRPAQTRLWEAIGKSAAVAHEEKLLPIRRTTPGAVVGLIEVAAAG